MSFVKVGDRYTFKDYAPGIVIEVAKDKFYVRLDSGNVSIVYKGKSK